MPRLGKQPGSTDRAYIHVAKKRHSLGACNDLTVQELYARLTRVWKRTGQIDLTLIAEAQTPSSTRQMTIAELGERFRHYAEQRYVNPDGTLSKEFHNVRAAWRIVRESEAVTPVPRTRSTP